MGSCFSGQDGENEAGGRRRAHEGERGGERGKNELEGGRSINAQEFQNYNPVRYLSNQGVIRHPNRIVHRVHFVAETVLRNGGNHWVINLQTDANESIRINMEPGGLLGAPKPGHGSRGRMDIVHRDYAVTTDCECIITVPANPGHSVAQFIDAIISAGNHEYDFTTEGRGCTGWILDQFRLFRQLALIPPKFDILETAIDQEWIEGRQINERPATRGFYMRDTKGGGWSRNSPTGSGAGKRKAPNGR